MIDDATHPIVTIIEGSEMNASQVDAHLKKVQEEAVTVSNLFGHVSLLINALEKNFHTIDARRKWSKGIKNFPNDLPIHKVAFVVLPEDIETADYNISDKPWAETFLNIDKARSWLEKEW